jgi:RND superfamily putative drug exporter
MRSTDRLATTEDRPTRNAPKPAQPNALSSSRLYRWGLAVARARRVVLGVSVLLIVVSAAAYPALQQELGAPSIAVNGSDSARSEQVIERLFPLGSEDDAVVFHSSRHIASDRTYRAVIAAVDRTVGAQKGVRSVTGPYAPNAVDQILAGEHNAFSLITVGGGSDQRYANTRSIQTALTRAAAGSGVQVWLTGTSPILRELAEQQKINTQHAESIGIPVALVILLLAMGALVAALLPLLLAFAGLLLAFGVLAVLALLFHFDSFLLAIVTLIGLGLGIDYALFIVSRFREELARHTSSEESHTSSEARHESERVAHALGVALATSGRTILFSGVVVALSLASLFVVSADIYREVAIGAMVVVICMLGAALTLLPAVLAMLGEGVNKGALPVRLRPPDAQPGWKQGQQGGWARWARLVMRRPVLAAAATAAVLLLAASPILHLRYGFNVSILQASDTAPAAEGQQLLTHELTPGAGGPIQIVVTNRGGGAQTGSGGGGGGARAGSGSDTAQASSALAAASALNQELESDKLVTGISERRSKAGAVLLVFPSVTVESRTATALVQHIRNDLAPPLQAHRRVSVLVGGPTAVTLDGAEQLRTQLPLFLALILGPSLLFLLIVFRSVVLPIKAVLMNLLATAATMGLAVWIFQDGHGHQLLGFTSTGYIQFTVPLIMFALLFGLSMDYEIFLIRRVQEEWRRTGDNTLAVASGIEHTARMITAAAAIMVAVFGCFLTTNLLELKQLGFTLAAAIALDATLIRLVLVPATMRMLGASNWWLPAWLARVLPGAGSTGGYPTTEEDD